MSFSFNTDMLLKNIYGVVLSIKGEVYTVKTEVSSLKNHVNSEVINSVMNNAYEKSHSNAEKSFDKCQNELVQQWNQYRHDLQESYAKHERMQRDYQKSVKAQQPHTEDLINVIVSIFHNVHQ